MSRRTLRSSAKIGSVLRPLRRYSGQKNNYCGVALLRIRYLERSIGFQRNFEAARWLAAVHSARHKFQQALPYARESVSAIPSDIESQAALFDAHLGLGDREAASAILTKMLNQGPSFAADTRLSALRQKEGNSGEALQSMNRACEAAEASRAPAETRAWCQTEAGLLYLRNGQRDAAKKAYERALEILPGYHHALRHVAELAPNEGPFVQSASLDQSVPQP